MYILASSVSDDQVPEISKQVSQYVTDFGGSDITETQLGKKKLAYPIKKTRNGFYVVVDFTIDTTKINQLDAKIRTQDSTIIRYLIINQDEHLARLEKDKVEQAKLSRPIPEDGTETDAPVRKEAEAKTTPKKPPVEMNAEELDKKIEEALSDNLIK
jgi:small subunit ribosomal protein S6